MLLRKVLAMILHIAIIALGPVGGEKYEDLGYKAYKQNFASLRESVPINSQYTIFDEV